MERKRIDVKCDRPDCNLEAAYLVFNQKRERNGQPAISKPEILCEPCFKLRRHQCIRGRLYQFHLSRLSWDESSVNKFIGYLTSIKGKAYNDLSSSHWRKRLWNIHFVTRGNNHREQREMFSV